MSNTRIHDVQPKLSSKVKGKVWLSIIGQGFSSNSTVTIFDKDEIHFVPKSRTKLINSELLQVCIFLDQNEKVNVVEVEVDSCVRKINIEQ